MARKKIKYDNDLLYLPKQSQIKPTFDFKSETMKYYNILFELYATTFKWKNLPKEIIDGGGELYLEKVLCSRGSILFFYDNILKEYMVQQYTGYGINFYYQPLEYHVVAPTTDYSYNRKFKRDEAVAIYNSPYFTGEINTIRTYAEKLAICDMAIMLNINTQKTPYIVKCAEGQKQTLINLLKQVDEFNTAILATDTFDENSIEVLPLNAPFVAENIYSVKDRFWKEALNFAGSGFGSDKRERVNVLEEVNNESYRFAMLETRLASRKMACEQINNMFGLDIDVELREDLQLASDNKYTEERENKMNKEGGSDE